MSANRKSQIANRKSAKLFVVHCSLIPAGLFLSRVALEATRRPWPGVLVVAVGLLAVLGSLALGHWLARRHVCFWPALLLVVYVVWPRRDPLAAASVAVLAALVWLLSSRRASLPRRIEPLADGMTFAVALAVYAATAARDVLPADAGEFQLVAARLGVAHPPGYPLYTLIGHLFIRLLPWGTPAYRLNLMSSVLAAGTLVLVARATRLWARSLRGRPRDGGCEQGQVSPLVTIASGLVAALALGTATTFWAQATIANVRTPAVFFAALALYWLARFATSTGAREADHALVLLGLTLGLGLSHYPPLAFVSLFFAIYVLVTDPHLALQPRRWWRPLLAGLAGLLPLLYLPIRGAMGALLAPPNLDTLPGFLHHFLARGFVGDMFAFANAADLPHRLALLPTLFPFQFNTLLLVTALAGLLGLLRRDWRLFVLLAGSLLLHTFVTLTYRAPQTVEYLMPAYLPIAIAIGLLPSLSSLPPPPSSLHSPFSIPYSPFPILHSPFPSLLCALLLWAGLFNGWAHAPSFIELAGDASTRQTVAPLLERAPEGALILADWHWAMPLRYLQEVEGIRPDVEVRYVYNVAGEEYRDTWLRRVQAVSPGWPLILTHFYEFDGYTSEPWEAGFLVRPRPVTEPAAPLVPVVATFGEGVKLLGYSLRQEQLHAGQVAEFVLAWQAAGPLDPPPSFTLRLEDAEGRSLAQADRALGTDCAPGEVRFERLALPLYPTLAPGRYRVTLGAYMVTGAGFETLPAAAVGQTFQSAGEGETSITLTDLELVPLKPGLQSALFTLHPQAVPFSDGPQWVGVDYDRSVPGTLRVYLRWQGPAGEGLVVRMRTRNVADWKVCPTAQDAAVPLPSMPAGAYQTVAVELQDATSGAGFPACQQGALWLSLTDGQGQVKLAAGPWGWPAREVRLPAPLREARFVPLGDEMAVVGATARPVTSGKKGGIGSGCHPAASGEMVAVDVTLVALRPLVNDDGTSVRLMDGEGRWLAAHDCQPALGAVPTLKWIRGSRVIDRHLLPLPADFPGGEVQATLVAYERFRMTPLPPMDGRFSQVPLGTWDVP
jgi:hypothetical protein